ncbi:hypothetical protein H6501_02615 [Candidatus Woesearchaeota archaeon]|nr:hypothetical protein [Candidatus Woesearchaeota archaeon]USN43542.1 MAG: hypothetical protein H6500_04060 [Candidatus Woesearchaeota archaeon]
MQEKNVKPQKQKIKNTVLSLFLLLFTNCLFLSTDVFSTHLKNDLPYTIEILDLGQSSTSPIEKIKLTQNASTLLTSGNAYLVLQTSTDKSSFWMQIPSELSSSAIKTTYLRPYEQGSPKLLSSVCQAEATLQETISTLSSDSIITYTAYANFETNTELEQRLAQLQTNYKTAIENNMYMKVFAYLEITIKDAESGHELNKRYLLPTKSTTDGTYFYNAQVENSPTNLYGTFAQFQDLSTSTHFAFFKNISLMNNARIPYQLLKEESSPKTFSFSLAELNPSLLWKNNSVYDLTLHLIPIDGKCDFNENGILEENSEFMVTSLTTATIYPLSNSDPSPYRKIKVLGEGNIASSLIAKSHECGDTLCTTFLSTTGAGKEGESYILTGITPFEWTAPANKALSFTAPNRRVFFSGPFNMKLTYNDASGQSYYLQNLTPRYLTPQTVQRIIDSKKDEQKYMNLFLGKQASAFSNFDLFLDTCSAHIMDESFDPTTHILTIDVLSSLEALKNPWNFKDIAGYEDFSEYYDMKILSFLKISNPSTGELTYLAAQDTSSQDYAYSQGGVAGTDKQLETLFGSEFLLLKNKIASSVGTYKVTKVSDMTTSIQFDLSPLYEAAFLPELETPQIEIYAIPVDGKCDFDENGLLEGTESKLSSWTIESSLPLGGVLGTEQTPIEVKKLPRGYSLWTTTVNEETAQELVFNNKKNEKRRFVLLSNGSLYFKDRNDELHFIAFSSFVPVEANISINYKELVADGSEEFLTDPSINPETKAPLYLKEDTILKMNLVTQFRNKEDALEKVNKTLTLMNFLDIEKNLTYIESTNRTRVLISVKNVPLSYRENLTIYVVLPKEDLPSLEKLTLLTNSKHFFVKDKDPIIGWQFNFSDENESVGFELEGNASTGTVIVTQDPVIYNEGNLLINYRQEQCNPDEAYLFDINDLIDSPVNRPQSSDLYHICVGHTSHYLTNQTLSSVLNLFNMTTAATANLSITGFFPSFTINLSDQTDPFTTWSFSIGSLNPGGYSCLGSLENTANSLFGDCEYTENRVWIKLNTDDKSPQTTISISSPGGIIEATLNASDLPNPGASGVKGIYYCVDELGVCNPDNISSFSAGENITFSLTCSGISGCTKYVRFFAEDNKGNKEALQTETVTILDKGSKCEADCTAKPTPNRYLKECNGVSGCSYYPFAPNGVPDAGVYVANACHFLTKGSYASYNASHDILCPNGPVIAKRLTNETVDTKESTCEHIVKDSYLVLVNGEKVEMSILVCLS